MKIVNSKFIKSAITKDQWIDDDTSEVLLLGRSNVGKSTFINTLCHHGGLAKVSSTPGKTQMLNFFNINNGQFRLVDSPGYGFAKISKTTKKQFIKMMETYLKSRTNLKLAILLLDLRREPTEDDMIMFRFLIQSEIKTIIVTTKLDKLRKNDIEKQYNLIIKTLCVIGADDIIMTSSLNKVGYEKIYRKIALAI